MINIKKYLPKGISNSAIFWNSLLLIALIVLTIISYEFGVVLYIMMSFLTIGFFMDVSTMSEEEWNRNLWIYITAPFIAALVLVGIGAGIFWIYDQTVNRFNCYINKKEYKSFFKKD